MKESDRLSAVTQVLNALGSRVEEHPDSLTILGVDTLGRRAWRWIVITTTASP